MLDQAWATAAQFRYIHPRGTTYLVRGYPADPPNVFQRALMWLAFRVDVGPEGKQAGWVSNWFMIPIEFVEDMGERPDSTDIQVKWLRALRQYALDHVVQRLDAGTLEDPQHVVIDDAQELSQCLPRRCEFMIPGISGTECAADPGDDKATTQAICDACAVPDVWERCANIRNIRTYPIGTDQEGIVQRECTAQCDLGKQPSDAGGVPQQCRYGNFTPPCFEPQLLQAQPEIKRGHMGLGRPDDD